MMLRKQKKIEKIIEIPLDSKNKEVTMNETEGKLPSKETINETYAESKKMSQIKTVEGMSMQVQ